MTASFRLMTANLLTERCDAADFSRVLRNAAPDILFAQELAPRCADAIASFFPNHWLRPSVGFRGRGAATRFDAEFDTVDMPGRPGTSIRVAIGATTVNLIGLHLLNPLQLPWWATARGRGHQIDGLFAWLDRIGKGPVVVAGDFNATPRWPAYKRTVGRLTDLPAEWAERNGTQAEPTWAWRSGWPRMLRIDHVFGQDVRATGVDVEPIRGTDHAALVVDIEVIARP